MKTIICDLDGTLCDITHRRHHVEDKSKGVDWKAFFDGMVYDTLNEWCRDVIHGMQMLDHEIIFVTGRPDSHKEHTIAWLVTNGFHSHELYMRKTGDYRPDYQIKAEIYDQHLADKDILFVIDDRKQVVDMWRSKGLTVLQCAEGDF